MLCGGLEHLKIKTRLLDEKFASVMGESEVATVFVVYYETMRDQIIMLFIINRESESYKQNL